MASVDFAPSKASSDQEQARYNTGGHIMAIVPPNAETRLGDFRPIIRASEEASYYRETKKAKASTEASDLYDVVLVDDPELCCEAVDLLGAGVQLVIAVKCSLPYLVLQLRDMDRFTSVQLTLVDTNKRVRRYTVGNKQTMVRVKGDSATAPLLLVPGWNYIPLHLPAIMQEAFGATFAYCKEVIITSTVRVGRVFFQDAMYEDAQLPSFLRTLK